MTGIMGSMCACTVLSVLPRSLITLAVGAAIGVAGSCLFVKHANLRTMGKSVIYAPEGTKELIEFGKLGTTLLCRRVHGVKFDGDDAGKNKLIRGEESDSVLVNELWEALADNRFNLQDYIYIQDCYKKSLDEMVPNKTAPSEAQTQS